MPTILMTSQEDVDGALAIIEALDVPFAVIEFTSDEVRRRKKTGKEIWLAANDVPIRSKDGGIDGVRKNALVNAVRELANGSIFAHLEDRVRAFFGACETRIQ